MTALTLRVRWRNCQEVALFDAREEGPFAEAHPFFAVSLPLSKVEMLAYSLVPRLSAPVVVYDAGEGLAEAVALRLRGMGYTDVSLLEGALEGGLEGGLAGWVAAGGELFRDVNVPGKAFGELVETTCHTPSLPADEVNRLIAEQADMVVLDVRRFSEYQTMNIPGGVSVPGAELALRVRDIAPSAETLVVVNCAGRTRSIIGTQSLVNAAIPNRVAALRNGTIGWTLAGFALEHGQARQGQGSSHLAEARAAAERCAARTGVREIDASALEACRAEANQRTLYCLDVRSQQEYEAGHPAGFTWAAGGQLVQAADEWIAVRGARIVLFDDDGVRARMTGSWLAQMGWDVSIVKPGTLGCDETGIPAPRRPPVPDALLISPAQLMAIAHAVVSDAVVVDLAPSPVYHRGHIPGARFLLRSRFATDAARISNGIPASAVVVLTSIDGMLARYAAPELAQAMGRSVNVLDGGTEAWAQAGYPIESDRHDYVSPAIDVYKRPYEGTDSTPQDMRAYIEWELQLVEQIRKDGVANFNVMIPDAEPGGRGTQVDL
jgi:rhodanese-related sulfurtransferase